MGLRSPRMFRLIEQPGDRIAIWLEDIDHRTDHDGDGWDLDRFGRAGRLLGEWNARSTSPALFEVSGLANGFGLRMYAERAVGFRGLMPLESDEIWSHPWLAGHQDLRDRLRELGRRIPAMLDRLDELTQCLPHGDASPQNLLVPLTDDEAEFVAIDLSFRSPHALGFDLGQLLVGLVHAGLMDADRMPAVAERIVAEYVGGVADAGVVEVPEDELREGFALSVMLRSGFDAIDYSQLGESADSPHEFKQRIGLSRFLASQLD